MIKLSQPDIKLSDYLAVLKVMKSKWLVAGDEQKKLEIELAAYLNFNNAIACSSWTTGAFMVLKALGIGPGDEVIVPSYSFIATANVVKHVGAEVVFCDINTSDWNLSLPDLKSKINSRTKGIIAVDQHGFPLDQNLLQYISDSKLFFIRDIACALGTDEIKYKNNESKVIAITSFHARKIITGGEGGMIFTNDDKLAALLKLMRHQGMNVSDFERSNSNQVIVEQYPIVGYNFRLTDLQAALIRSQFKRLSSILHKRRKLAKTYLNFLPLDKIEVPTYKDSNKLNWQSFMISISSSQNSDFRNRVIEELNRYGVQAKKGISPAHLEFAYVDHNNAYLPNTQEALNKNILLPLHTSMKASDVKYICEKLKEIITLVENE